MRLFEAAACGTPIISDPWPGLETFFEPGREILIARTAEDALRVPHGGPRGRSGARSAARARRRVLADHTAAHRARELEGFVAEAAERRTRRRTRKEKARPAAT